MKIIIILILVAVAITGGSFLLSGGGKDLNANIPAISNVSVVDGKQIITINAKGGYFPQITTAKAGMPTVIKMNTRGTFDCSSAISIPSLGYRGYLPPSGETLIDVPPQKAGSKLQGLCSMGMYNFTVNFN